MSEFSLFVDELLDVNEGSAYTPNDCGRGPSKWGVTLETYRHWDAGATADTIRDMTRDEAAYFYRFQFGWEPLRIGAIRSQAVAEKVFDLQVNTGFGIVLLQRAVGAKPDGKLGPLTAAAVNGRAETVVLQGIYDAGKTHYEEVIAAHPEFDRFRAGWMARLAKGIPSIINV